MITKTINPKIDTIKHDIKFKFRTIRRFCELTGIDERRLRNFIAGKLAPQTSDEMCMMLTEIIKNTEVVYDPKYLTYEQRKFIRDRIYTRYRCVRNFCQTFPEYKVSYMSMVINGTKKRLDAKAQYLIQILKADLFKPE